MVVEAEVGKFDPFKGVSRPPANFSASDYYRRRDMSVSAQAILAQFAPGLDQKIADTLARIASLPSTKQTYAPDGVYTPERQKEHDRIFREILTGDRIKAATPARGRKPTFIILGGRGGSGKSKLAEIAFDPSGFIVLDPDDIKQRLPGYEGWNATLYHEESSDIFKKITEACQKHRLNLVQDLTMKTTTTTISVVREFMAAGFEIEAHYMYAPRHVAAERALRRFLNPDSNRLVPPDVILMNTTNEATFDAVKALAKRWSFWDNDVVQGMPPQIVSEKRA